jgi:hypothetical protein
MVKHREHERHSEQSTSFILHTRLSNLARGIVDATYFVKEEYPTRRQSPTAPPTHRKIQLAHRLFPVHLTPYPPSLSASIKS